MPQPEPAPDEVLIRVMFCGICGTDLEEYREGPLTVQVATAHPTSGRLAPLTLGHEMVGMVERAAADGSGPAVGQLVLPDSIVGCGHCWWCLRRQEGQCARLSIRGQTDDGGLADYVCARAATCIVVPDGLDVASAALAEPASVAVRAIRKLDMPLGARIGVVGGGTIGQLTAQVARAAGASLILLVDPIADRRAMAEALAGARTCSPGELAEIVRQLPEPGLDAVIECSGRPGVLAQSVALVRNGGTVVAVGLRPGDEAISLLDLVVGEKHIVGSAAHLWDTDVADAVTMMSDGRLNVGPLITHRVGLDDLVDVGLALLSTPDSGALKVLIDCR